MPMDRQNLSSLIVQHYVAGKSSFPNDINGGFPNFRHTDNFFPFFTFILEEGKL